MTTHAEGIISPSIDSLLETTDSKYALVIYGAKRARQINAYYAQLHEGLFEYVGPLVETRLNEKPLSIALREIDGGMLERKAVDPEAVQDAASALDDADVFGDTHPTA
ncbi:DNA-directed RNA polymerase subunit omega [Tersicoccus sp. Bi-70]|uniref:DNA-directed RNA polymerase subunit omega n=1 Tax=Tersicoccus sp. Bi-70 TaxID=1897634 RepID=UPI000977E119|nr:DNA-directed RNA polymerase subunit omega [Tersicoccus sp. Bi-70]OMH37037.1 DNA-directed RNA polymerase subunit omega [Tersicoccus sp. Bi-70]